MGKFRQYGFTLAELLTVLVIIAIVLSIGIPAVNNLMKAGALNSGSRDVSNALNLARQFAITHRTNTRVVFPYSGTGSRPDMWYHTYAIMTNRDTTAPNGWRYVTKWEHLPVGAVFVHDQKPNPTIVGALNNPNSLPFEINLPFPDSSLPGNVGTLSYIEFMPTGVASLTGTLTMQGGFIANNGFPQPTAPYNSVTCVVDSVVGRIQLIHP